MHSNPSLKYCEDHRQSNPDCVRVVCIEWKSRCVYWLPAIALQRAPFEPGLSAWPSFLHGRDSCLRRKRTQPPEVYLVLPRGRLREHLALTL